MKERRITLYKNNVIKRPTNNKIIIDYAVEFTGDRKFLYNINYMRRKRAILTNRTYRPIRKSYNRLLY